MGASYEEEITQQISQLTPKQQQDVLKLVQSLNARPSRAERRQAILNLAGSIPKDDIEIMKSVIEADCERIDTDGW
jgi:hypothetical protein